MVGLTGGIGSGKSTVASILASLGAEVVDSDAIVHELQAAGSPMLADLAEAFGSHIIDAAGNLDRKALGDIVFRDPGARERLNGIVHPKVGAETLRRIAAARERGVPLVVVDIPLLFETREAGRGTGAAFSFEGIIVVYATEEAQVERQLQRNIYDRAEALRRVRAQMALEEKRELADFVVDNTGTREETELRVRELFDVLVDDPC